MIQAVGHNSDGIMAFDRSNGLLIAGDYLSNIEFPYIYESWTAYGKTLATVKKMIHANAVQLLIPGHGDHTNSIDEMKTRIERDQKYLELIRETVLNEDQNFDVDDFLKLFKFPKVMKAFHEANMKLLQQEFSI